jgi:predicted MFS family arabinose efflux permease
LNATSTRTRLAALCFGNFIIGTGTLIVPGMLPALAQGLGVSMPAAGQLITAFAFTVCVGAPLLAGATSRIERRRLLVAMQILFFAGHAAAALAPAFLPLLAARVVTSVGAALFTAQAAATCALLVPAQERGRAIAFVFLGWSVASVAGMPLGAYVSETLGWRAGFLLVAGGSLAAAAAVRLALPGGLQTAPIDRAMWHKLFSDRILLAVVAVTAIQSAAQFTILSYVVPAMKALVEVSHVAVSALLAAFGIAGVVGNACAGRLIDRYGAATVVLGSMLAMLAGHLLWPWTAGQPALLALALLVWGLGCFAANSAQQARLAAISPALAPVSIAMNTSSLYLGQAAGAALGGAALARSATAAGYAALPLLSVPLFLAAIALSAFAARERKPGR